MAEYFGPKPIIEEPVELFPASQILEYADHLNWIDLKPFSSQMRQVAQAVNAGCFARVNPWRLISGLFIKMHRHCDAMCGSVPTGCLCACSDRDRQIPELYMSIGSGAVEAKPARSNMNDGAEKLKLEPTNQEAHGNSPRTAAREIQAAKSGRLPLFRK
jgi:hypothetical protein